MELKIRRARKEEEELSPAEPLLEVGLGGGVEGLVVREHGQHDGGGVDHVVPVRLHTQSMPLSLMSACSDPDTKCL